MYRDSRDLTKSELEGIDAKDKLKSITLLLEIKDRFDYDDFTKRLGWILKGIKHE